ncbi:hypothetical protein LUZ60_010568 [Juncus effusus]|nr:hypothetical protein LUZ60_010568 [Juncus effusus]
MDSTRTILNGVSGAVLPGEMLAMLGPSGSGKTTLLTILGGRNGISGTKSSKAKLSGNITYNGRPFSTSLTRSIGFVTQDDVLYPHLTVTETLVYTALLRLPSSISRKEKTEIAESVMSELGLMTCRNSIIGGRLVRGVSGGERKRVSIGQELLINPSLLFLDEPTSGLDSTIADGHPIYFGTGSHVMDYFASVGYEPNVPMNPADFLLDLANGVSPDETVDDKEGTKEALVTAYRTQLHNSMHEELQEVGKHLNDESDKEGKQWCTSWWDQFTVLVERDLKERKHEAFSSLKLTQIFLTSLLAGLLWLRSGGHVQDQVGLLYFMVGFWNFYPSFQAIFTFPQERMMLTKERSSRMYRLSSYFMARTLGDLPMELILPAISVTIVYWMGCLKPTFLSYISFLIVVLVSVLVAQGFGLAVGALVMELKAATTFASVVMLCFMLVGGYFIGRVPAFIAWVKYIAISFYVFKLMLVTQFSPNETYECAPNVRCSVMDFPPIKAGGHVRTDLAIVVLAIMLIFYRFLAYMGLRRVGNAS